ncbi:hypothetical protein BD413DRAFT_483567 [Trametes elegans]|nr:hypothetical protein BD413DRAFT_483567 [Trametes elegans]
MDAVDLNWCLHCGCRIELGGYSQAYCSPQCHTAEIGSSSALQLHPSSRQTSSYFSEPDVFVEEEPCHIQDCSFDEQPPPDLHNSWVGRGSAGILAWAQSVTAGAPLDADEPSTVTMRPVLLDRAGGHVKPSLCMSRAQPAPPEPSRPILTPQQSLPSLTRASTSINSASVVSLTTGSSSYSLATPATGSVVGSLAAIDCRQTNGKSGLFGGLKAQLRVLTSTTSLKEKHRSSTITRRDSDSDAASINRAQKTRRAGSPVAFYHMPEEYGSGRRKEATRSAMQEKAHPPPPVNKRATATAEPHPAYRMRGRKASRLSS